MSDLYTEKLKSSGLSIADGKKLGYKFLTAAQTKKLGHKEIPSLLIPYYGAEGKPLKFYRVRYLESTKRGFMAQTDAKDQRYDQPLGLSPEVYLPPLYKWSSEFKKTEAKLFVTEGELKAAAACARGIPTIALGGVWNFCARKNGVGLLPIFNAIEGSEREIYIVFDSDAVTNPNVAAAENAFCRELIALGHSPRIIRLPSVNGKKTGLDDYLLEHSLGDFDKLVFGAEEWRLGAELHKMNEEVIYIENPSLVLRHSDNYKMAVPTFKNEVFANRTFIDYSGEKAKKVKTAEEWVKWEGRAVVNKMVYEPGQPLLVDGKLNMWRGLPYEPKRGNVDPWHKLMDYVFAGDKDARRYFEQWLAYPLQYLGTKLFTAVVIWSVQTGTGKTLIGHTMQRLYGAENSIMIRKRDLMSGNNSFAENKQFILGEEITGDERRGMVDELKSLITNEEMRVNIKYVPEYSIRSCANYYFTSNNPDAFYVDETDRRFFIHEIVGDPLPEDWYTDVYDPWYKSDSGAAALLHYLLNLDLSDFKPMGRAPMTGAKEEMIENSRTVLGSWVHNLRENPDKVLKIGNAVMPQALYSTEELLKIFDPEDKKRLGVRGMGVELKRARIAKAARGVGCRTKNGQMRLWAVRDPARYVNLNPKQAGEAYDAERVDFDNVGEKKKPKFTKEKKK